MSYTRRGLRLSLLCWFTFRQSYLEIGILILLLCGANTLPAQPPVLNHTLLDFLQPTLPHQHQSVRPYNPFWVQPALDSFQLELAQENRANWLSRKVWNEHLLHLHTEDYELVFDPLGDLSLGAERGQPDALFYNGRAAQLYGRIGQRVRFYSHFQEVQSRLPQYVYEQVRSSRVTPGEGQPKFQPDRILDYGISTGYVSWQPSRFFNFQFGHGKHFWGNGYRSLLLSDVAFNYPYLRIQTSFWKLRYVNLFTQMLNIQATMPGGAYQRKYTSAHYLSVAIHDKLEIGLFEAIVYEDSTGTRGYDINYLNPVIFYRPIEISLNSASGNALLGMNLSYRPWSRTTLYGQFVLDEFSLRELRRAEGWWANKFGWQLGIKLVDTGLPNLTTQIEINYVRPYTYTHRGASQNYAHFNEPLAHPLGANFIETLFRFSYRYGRWLTAGRYVRSVQGEDTADQNWGADLFRDYNTRVADFGNETLQGVRTVRQFLDINVGYWINPASNMQFRLGASFRSIEAEALDRTPWVYAQLSSAIGNRYYDR